MVERDAQILDSVNFCAINPLESSILLSLYLLVIPMDQPIKQPSVEAKGLSYCEDKDLRSGVGTLVKNDGLKEARRRLFLDVDYRGKTSHTVTNINQHKINCSMIVCRCDNTMIDADWGCMS